MKKLSETYNNLRFSDVTKYEIEQIKELKKKFSNEGRIVMFCELNENNKDLFKSIYDNHEILNNMLYTTSEEYLDYERNAKAKYFYELVRRKKFNEPKDISNNNEINVDYYVDLIKNAKPKKTKPFSVDIIETPIDLKKELSEEYIEKCKKTEKIIKEDLLTHISKKEYIKPEYKKLQNNYNIMIIFKDNTLLLYDDFDIDKQEKVFKNFYENKDIILNYKENENLKDNNNSKINIDETKMMNKIKNKKVIEKIEELKE